MLDRMVEEVRQREVFCRENTSTEQRVLGAFLYHAGLSYRKVERFVERSYEAGATVVTSTSRTVRARLRDAVNSRSR